MRQRPGLFIAAALTSLVGIEQHPLSLSRLFWMAFAVARGCHCGVAHLLGVSRDSRFEPLAFHRGGQRARLAL